MAGDEISKSVMLRFLGLAFLLVPSGMLYAQSRTLDIYWIDVEGGAAVVISHCHGVQCPACP
jgi:hypothetical protein